MAYKTMIVRRKNKARKQWMWDVWANGVRIIAYSTKKLSSKHADELKRRK